jgi:hypothetical protein
MGFDERDYARKRAEARQQSSWFKLAVGDNCFRILPTPPTDNVKTNFFEYAIHREVGPRKQTVRCGVDIDPQTGDQVGECWLCDTKIPALKAKKQESRATALAAKSQLIMQVAKVEELGEGKLKFAGPFLFTPAPTIGNQLLASIFGNRKRSYIDPKKGYNLNISRTGTGRNDTRYGIIEPDQDPTVVPQSLIDKVKAFEDLKEIPVYSQAKQQAAYMGQDVVDEQEEEEQPRRSATRKPAAPEPEDDDLPEDDVVEDDESAEADIDPDAEGEDVIDDIDDEPEPPTRKKTGSVPAPKATARPARKAVVPDPDEDEAEDADPDAEDIPDDLDEDIDLDAVDDADLDTDADEGDVIDDEPDTPPVRKARPVAAAAKPAARPASRPASPPARPAARAAAPAAKPALRPKARR